MKVAVLVSGNGTNLQNIIDKTESKELPIEIACVIANTECFALERAKKHNIPEFLIPSKGKIREQHEGEIIAILKDHKIKLIVLAGYMRLLTPKFISSFRNKIINIHPALLPSFAGPKGYEDAWNYGVKVSGCTVHFVDEGTDTGPIILQKTNNIRNDDTFTTFKERGLKVEHEAYAEAIKLIAENKYKIEGRKVTIS